MGKIDFIHIDIQSYYVFYGILCIYRGNMECQILNKNQMINKCLKSGYYSIQLNCLL